MNLAESSSVETPTGMKISLKNTFINVDEEFQGSELCMPDLLRAQTTPAVYDALQALYQSAVSGDVTWGGSALEVLTETPKCQPEDVLPPPPFDEVLRQLSETLSTMNCGDFEQLTCMGSVSEGTVASLETPTVAVVDESSFTTVMLRNIPNKYAADKLLEQFVLEGFSSHDMDFFYLPIDFRNKCNVGYAFINFLHHNRAIDFMNIFESYRLPATNSSKICTVCWARIQGSEANVSHYRDSPIQVEYRPWLFNEGGVRVPFPEPTDASVLTTIAKSNAEAIRASNATKGPDEHKVFVGGLDRTILGDDLVEYFSQFGQVRDAAVVIDRTSGKSRGFGFCLFEKFVPRDVLLREHAIKGCPIAVKMYDQPSKQR
jgi:RNA recognition motif-containing protein